MLFVTSQPLKANDRVVTNPRHYQTRLQVDRIKAKEDRGLKYEIEITYRIEHTFLQEFTPSASSVYYL